MVPVHILRRDTSPQQLLEWADRPEGREPALSRPLWRNQNTQFKQYSQSLLSKSPAPQKLCVSEIFSETHEVGFLGSF